ncbi:Nodule Cysteine-Rich (NCR) secreted peptide [Caenorhabditis elegans]|uniref:Nodule Cysteine-Rich (NCR) secreted peptide n=1 Tax=Caenorhabditis elegans TaxID=6239 RepID=Q17501_CAEEL|nr:Nodule Cysteine-Rich (NCR) secreted peptide [Caenorhabditis elegans]CCD61851.2 Nodule Cysteine-Rich (NCR) secreted peptide [Caenorhabditis elegans]
MHEKCANGPISTGGDCVKEHLCIANTVIFLNVFYNRNKNLVTNFMIKCPRMRSFDVGLFFLIVSSCCHFHYKMHIPCK